MNEDRRGFDLESMKRRGCEEPIGISTGEEKNGKKKGWNFGF